MSYTINYNGVSSSSVGLVVEHRVAMPSSKEDITEYEIPARDGKLHRKEGTVQDVDIPVEFAFITADENKWMESYRKATSFLYATGNNRLIFSDDPDWYYNVKYVTISDNMERILWNGGRFTAVFTVSGYAYLLSGNNTTNNYTNNYDISHPLFVLTGSGYGTLSVNGNTMRVNVGGEVRIDTDLKIAYRADGTMANTEVTGDYEGLYLRSGSNSISLTGGPSFTVYPRWRKRI